MFTLFGGVKGAWSLVILFTISALLFFFVALPLWQVNHLPEPFYVELPEFKGRILPGEMVRPGTFTVKEEFESISQWGDESLLSYQGWRREVQMNAWRPDVKTAGVFQYSSKSFPVPEDWGIYHAIADVKREGSRLKVSAGSGELGLPLTMAPLFSIILLLLFTLVNPTASKWIGDFERKMKSGEQ